MNYAWTDFDIEGEAANEPLPPPVALIARVTANACGVTLSAMLSERRLARVIFARHIAMYLAQKLTFKSYPILGRAFRRDHSTVVHAVQQMEKKKDSEPYASKLAEIEALIKAEWGSGPNVG